MSNRVVNLSPKSLQAFKLFKILNGFILTFLLKSGILTVLPSICSLIFCVPLFVSLPSSRLLQKHNAVFAVSFLSRAHCSLLSWWALFVDVPANLCVLLRNEAAAEGRRTEANIVYKWKKIVVFHFITQQQKKIWVFITGLVALYI